MQIKPIHFLGHIQLLRQQHELLLQPVIIGLQRQFPQAHWKAGGQTNRKLNMSNTSAATAQAPSVRLPVASTELESRGGKQE